MDDFDVSSLPLEFRPQEVIDFLVERVAPKLAEVYEPDSCIAQTNLALKVLHHFGIPAVPQPVRVHIWNDLAFQFWQDNGWIDESTGEPYNYSGEMGRYALGIAGTGKINGERHSWDGHLIAVLPRQRSFLDMTCHQFSRPKWGIPLEPVVASWSDDDDFDPTDENCIVPFVTDHGAVVAYSPLTKIDPRGWTTAPDWRDDDGLIHHLANGMVTWLEAIEQGHSDAELSVTIPQETLDKIAQKLGAA